MMTHVRHWPEWAARSNTPWETVAVDGSRGERNTRGGCSRTSLWDTPRLPPVALRSVWGADPAGKLRLEACCCTDRHATPMDIRLWGRHAVGDRGNR